MPSLLATSFCVCPCFVRFTAARYLSPETICFGIGSPCVLITLSCLFYLKYFYQEKIEKYIYYCVLSTHPVVGLKQHKKPSNQASRKEDLS